MTEEPRELLNDLFVELFHYILSLEYKILRSNDLNDLSMNEIHVIEAIDKTKVKSMSEVAKRLMITVGTLTTSINRLVTKGYVERQRDTNDRRIVFLNLTKKGEEVNKIHADFHRRMIRKILEGTDVGDDELLIASLVRIKEFFYALKPENI